MKKGVTLLLLTLFVPWMLRAQEEAQSLSLQEAVDKISTLLASLPY